MISGFSILAVSGAQLCQSSTWDEGWCQTATGRARTAENRAGPIPVPLTGSSFARKKAMTNGFRGRLILHGSIQLALGSMGRRLGV